MQLNIQENKIGKKLPRVTITEDVLLAIAAGINILFPFYFI